MTKEAFQKSLHVYKNRDRLTAYGVGIFIWEKYHNSWKYTNPPLQGATKFFAHGRILQYNYMQTVDYLITDVHLKTELPASYLVNNV